MKKFFSLFLCIVLLFSAASCTQEEITLFGDWVWIIDDGYAIFSITEKYIEVLSCDGYGDTANFEYEESTGYIYANLELIDMPSSVCIVPISNSQCVISFPVGYLDDEASEGLETFSTSHGEFYKYGYSIFKKDNDIEKFISKRKIVSVSKYNTDLLGMEFDIKNEYFYDEYSFLSLSNGKVLLVNNSDSLYDAFCVESYEDDLYLYNMEYGLTYFGNYNEDTINLLNEYLSINEEFLIYDANTYISLEKTGETSSNYPKAIPMKETNEEELLVGKWRNTSGDDWVFYSDGSCSGYADDDASLYTGTSYEGHGSGVWSFVDGKLKVKYGAYYGNGNGVLYHNYRFIDSNTLVIYNPLESEKIQITIYRRVLD